MKKNTPFIFLLMAVVAIMSCKKEIYKEPEKEKITIKAQARETIGDYVPTLSTTNSFKDVIFNRYAINYTKPVNVQTKGLFKRTLLKYKYANGYVYMLHEAAVDGTWK